MATGGYAWSMKGNQKLRRPPEGTLSPPFGYPRTVRRFVTFSRRMGSFRAKSLLVAAFLGAGCALIVTGCGGSNSETSSISTPTTSANQPVDRASFIRQANAICSEANGAVSSLPAGTADSSSVAEQASIIRGEVQQLHTLGTPASGKAQLDRFVAALDDLTRELQREKQAIASGGDTSVAATAVSSAQSTAQSAAHALGADKCAGTASPSGSAVASGGTSGGTVTPTTTTPVTPTTVVPTTPVPTTPTTPTPAPPPSSGGAGTTAPGGGTSTSGGSSGGVGTP